MLASRSLDQQQGASRVGLTRWRGAIENEIKAAERIERMRGVVWDSAIEPGSQPLVYEPIAKIDECGDKRPPIEDTIGRKRDAGGG
jgi:hypothetical protein